MAQNPFDHIDTSGELPFSLEAEQTILGAVLTDPEVLSVVLEKVKPEIADLREQMPLEEEDTE